MCSVTLNNSSPLSGTSNLIQKTISSNTQPKNDLTRHRSNPTPSHLEILLFTRLGSSHFPFNPLVK